MAVFDPQAPNLTPAYANITNQLQARATMESNRPSPLDIGTAVAKRADAELSAKRLFDQKMASEGKILVTKQHVQDFTDELNKGLSPDQQISSDTFKSQIGLWQTPESMKSIGEQKVFENTMKNPEDKAAAAVAPKEGAVLKLSESFGKFSKNNLKPGKSTSSSTGYSYYSIDPKTGASTDTGVEAPESAMGKGASMLTPQRRRDELYKQFSTDAKNISFQKYADAQSAATRSAAMDKPSGPADAKLMYAFAKMLQPTGVLSDQDFRTGVNTGSYKNNFIKNLNKLDKGDILDPDFRKQIVSEINSRYDFADKQLTQIEDYYQRRGALEDIPASTFVRDLRMPVEKSDKPKTVIQNGHTYTLNEKTGKYE